ncbi:hypothetical protein [Pseudomonas chlororaphis]|uniref:hypothetical protein n=1 Tax=Pseudomonas chlororaphis TaxID=587753 RepID=UPI0019D11B7B|nr:hypothetical protein [Pseudomonas chlororaphis]
MSKLAFGSSTISFAKELKQQNGQVNFPVEGEFHELRELSLFNPNHGYFKQDSVLAFFPFPLNSPAHDQTSPHRISRPDLSHHFPKDIQRFDAQALAYCLIGDHYHFVLHTRQANLSWLMRHVNGVYTQGLHTTSPKPPSPISILNPPPL